MSSKELENESISDKSDQKEHKFDNENFACD